MNLKRFLDQETRKMLTVFHLSHYEIKFYRIETEDAMSISVDTEYLRAEVSYGYLIEKMWKIGDKKQIRQVLTHEITHILIEQVLCEHTTKANEQVTEHISRLLFALYRRKT